VKAVPGRRLVLLRHGRTSWNAEGRAQGHADVELDTLGHSQAAAAAPYLASLRPGALWSSDLARARQTCDYVAKEAGLVASYDARLREFDVGARQGMTPVEFAEAFPIEYAAWQRGDPAIRVARAEGPEDVEARIVPALRERLAHLDPGATGVVVTHGAALKVGVAALLEWPPALAATLRGVENCAWVTLEESTADGRCRLVDYNQSVRPGQWSSRPDVER
jgi:broad specificity phosphatase PhoE